MATTISKPALTFLKQLKKNNNREWFNGRKDQYQKHRENVVEFADELLAMMNKHDNIETVSGKKVCTEFTETFVFLKTKHRTTRIGVAVFRARQNYCEEDITGIFNPAIQ